MIRGRRNLGRKSTERFREENTNPMENVANLVDVMLVFACALMIAIITFWKVDLSNIVDVVSQQELEKVDDLQDSVAEQIESDDFESKGTVYEDPETGDLYIVKKQEE